MRTKTITLIILLTQLWLNTKAQKISEKYLTHESIAYPTLPIPLSFGGYNIDIAGDEIVLQKLAMNNLNISYMAYDEDAPLSISFTIYNEQFQGTYTEVGDSMRLNFAVSAKLGYTLSEGINNFAFGEIDLTETEVRAGGTIETITNDIKEKISIHKSQLEEFMVYDPDKEGYTISPKYKKNLMDRQSALLIKKGCKKIMSLVGKSSTLINIKYLGIKKHTDEKLFATKLKEYKRDVYENGISAIPGNSAIEFWQERASSEEPLVAAVSLFNLVTAFTLYGDQNKAKKYYEQLFAFDVDLPKKQMERLVEIYSKNDKEQNRLYDVNGTYIFNEPLVVKHEGYVVFKTPGGMRVLTSEAYKKNQAQIKRMSEYEDSRKIFGDVGEVYTEDGKAYIGEIYVTFGYSVIELQDNIIEADAPGKSVTVRAENAKGKMRNTTFNSKKIDSLTVGDQKYYALEIGTFGSDRLNGKGDSFNIGFARSRNFFREVNKNDSGMLLQELSDIDMSFAVKLDHATEVIIFKNISIKDNDKRIAALLEDCTEFSPFPGGITDNLSKENLMQLLESHSRSCTK